MSEEKDKIEWGLEYQHQRLAHYEDIDDKEGIAMSHTFIGLLHFKMFNFNQALLHLKRSVALSEEIGYKIGLVSSFRMIGVVYRWKGNMNKALNNFQKSLNLSEEIGDKDGIAHSIASIGFCYLDKGDLNQGLSYIKQSLKLHEEIGNKDDYYHLLRNMGYIFMQKGDMDQVLPLFHQSLKYFEGTSNREGVAYSLAGIGQFFLEKGDLDQSLIHFQKSQTLQEELSINFIAMGNNLFKLLSIALEKNDLDLANHFLESLQQINEKKQVIHNSLKYRIAKALLLKANPRITQKSKAQEIFQEIVNEDIIDYNLTVFAMLNLCELLLEELKLTGVEEVLKQVKELLTKIHDVALQQQSSKLEVLSLMLREKLSLVDGDFEGAENYLETARMITDEKGLQKLGLKITQEQKNLRKELDKFMELISRNASLQDKIDQSGLKQGISDVIHLEEIEPHFDIFTSSYSEQR